MPIFTSPLMQAITDRRRQFEMTHIELAVPEAYWARLHTIRRQLFRVRTRICVRQRNQLKWLTAILGESP